MVGLYLSPPENALVPEKSQCQALVRMLPMGFGSSRMALKRHGTTTPVAPGEL